VSLTKEQLELRRQGLSSSDIVALSGTVPFKKRKTVYDVWLDKVHPDKVKPTEVIEAMELGHETEPIIVRRVAKQLGLAVVYPQTTVRHPTIEWAMSTPDALVVESEQRGVVSKEFASKYYAQNIARGLIECKLVGVHVADFWGESGDIENGPPDFVYTQVVWQMMVTGLPFCVVGAMIGTEVRTYRVEFDDAAKEYAEALVEMGAKFRADHVLTERPPPVDGSEPSRNMLAALFQKHNQVQIKADPQAEEAARAYFEAQRQVKEAKDLADNAKTVLMAKIQGNYGIRGEGWRCNWAEQKGYHVEGYDVPPMRKFDLRPTKRG
jgi:putative phage-type endonuclease